MTANLDGETNLKTRHSAAVTKGRIGSAAEAAGFVGFAECELPNPKLDAFVGRMTRMKPVEGRLRAVDKCALGQGWANQLSINSLFNSFLRDSLRPNSIAHFKTILVVL